MSTMTRQHFELIASALRYAKPSKGPIETETWRDITETMIAAIQDTNPNFKGDKFREACGL